MMLMLDPENVAEMMMMRTWVWCLLDRMKSSAPWSTTESLEDVLC